MTTSSSKLRMVQTKATGCIETTFASSKRVRNPCSPFSKNNGEHGCKRSRSVRELHRVEDAVHRILMPLEIFPLTRQHHIHHLHLPRILAIRQPLQTSMVVALLRVRLA